MKIFVSSNSYYLKKDKVDFILQNFSLEKIINLEIIEDYELISNLYKYNLLQQPILYIVDIKLASKLNKKQIEFLTNNESSNYICYYSNEETSTNINKIRNSCDFEYIAQIKSIKEKMEYIASYCTKTGLNASYDVLNHIQTLCNGNLDLVINETNKLLVYYGDEELNKDKVNLFVRDQRQDSMFDFYSLIFTNEKNKMLYFINSFIESSNMMQVFNGLKSYVFLAYQVKILLNENMDYVAIAKKLKRHEFYIQNICKSLYKVKLKDIEEFNDKLIKIDLQINSSSFNIKKIMYELL